MTPEQQRIAIAEACGWTEDDLRDIRRASDFGTDIEDGYPPVPDYLNDLNAMHAAEKVLTKAQFKIYAWQDCLGEDYEDCMHATAAQKAEAFLRTLNLWREESP